MSINEEIFESARIKNQLLDDSYLQIIKEMGREIISALKQKNKVLIAGNGGSAADAQHFAGELAGKFLVEKKPLPAMALTTNSSVLTAIANDFGYEEVFQRQVESLGQTGDIFFAISTSGNSENLVRALQVAKEKDLKTMGLLGKGGGEMKELCGLSLIVPSESTPRIQEVHILVIHLLCSMVDNVFANK